MSELVLPERLPRIRAGRAARAPRRPSAEPGRRRGRTGACRVAGEALMLATCGRVDTYAVGGDGDRAEAALPARLARRVGVTTEAPTPYVQALRGAAAARYVMRTAAGLESPVVGEPEILGQLRRAHDRARRAEATGPVLVRLVRGALRAGRRARPSWPATCSASARTPAKSAHHRPCPAPLLGTRTRARSPLTEPAHSPARARPSSPAGRGR
jgi:hypothetical protein